MKLEKAIEIVTKWKEPESVEEAEELHKARELVIEAGKRLATARRKRLFASFGLLPGETED